MVVYGYFLLQGAQLIGDGSEMLLHVLDPGIIGGLVLPVLGALPDAIMIVVAGLGSTDPAVVAENVKVGVGTLCGSTIMLLTLAWGGSVYLGRCDFNRSGKAIDRRLRRPADYKTTGVTCDQGTAFGARIMAVTVLLYLIVQVPASWPFDRVHDPTAALMGSLVCLLALAAYSVFQVRFPELQRRKIRRAHERFMRYHAVSQISHQMGGLLDGHGNVSRSKTDALFDQFDTDGDGAMDAPEVEAMVTGLLIALGDNISVAEQVHHWMTEFDADGDRSISKDEFFHGLTKWVDEKRLGAASEEGWLHAEAPRPEGEEDAQPLLGGGGAASDVEEGAFADAEEHGEEGGEDDESDEEDMSAWPKGKIAAHACGKLLLGTLICAVFADPMVEAVAGLSTATGIPSFYISFVVTPLASNASELLSSLQFARKKKRENISLTFSQVYGAVTMNNTLCLGLFLLVIYAQDLDWEYSAEVLVTVVSTLAIGAMAWSRVSFPTWFAFPVLALWPGSVVLMVILKNGLGME